MRTLTMAMIALMTISLFSCQKKPSDSADEVAAKNNNNNNPPGNQSQWRPIRMGEMADYELDKNSRRTSPLVNRGSATAKVVNQGGSGANAFYVISLDYDIDVTYVGGQTGQQNIDTPAYFFTDALMDELRQKKQMDLTSFKIRHLGIEDANTLDGQSYDKCDVVEIYDVQQGALAQGPSVIGLAESLMADTAAATTGTMNASVDNLVIRARLHPSVPVMGAVQLDIQASSGGLPLKAGFDYKKR
ncbi:MAG: hypothetical protein H6624_15415 [Bdellovibrionaceae bacterium]|nr:hypothetical protein [Bdellovibrionales bacterium]MCB9085735.1 hypothetical protein [Pseudobdellovibrionaceae bacterium]